MKINFCISYSCGKDSNLALQKMVRLGHKPVALIVTVNKDIDKSWFHGVDKNILDEMSKSLSIPLIISKSIGEDYEATFIESLNKAKEMGATACVFGDIDIEDHKEWCTQKCKLAGLNAIFPLWGKTRLEVVDEFIQSGIKGYIKTVSKSFKMSKDFIGMTLDEKLFNDIKKLELDPCGESGEYHSFCYDGELFSYPIKTEIIDIYESEYSFSGVLKKK